MTATPSPASGKTRVTTGTIPSGRDLGFFRGRPRDLSDRLRAVLDHVRRKGIDSLPLALQVWIDGLSDPDVKVRLECAKQIVERFGPRPDPQTHTSHAPPVIVYNNFANPFPPAVAVQAEVLEEGDHAALPSEAEQQG